MARETRAGTILQLAVYSDLIAGLQGLTPIAVDLISTQVDAAGQHKRRRFGERLSTNELALFTRRSTPDRKPC